MTGNEILIPGNKHVGEFSLSSSLMPKKYKLSKGLWNWIVLNLSPLGFRISGKLCGCNNDLGNPATADAYKKYWKDVEAFRKVNHLVVNCEVGHDTENALGIKL